MISREEELSQLRDFIREVDNDVTLILQRLQWDKNTLLQANSKVSCKYEKSHRIQSKNLQEHEEKCFLKSQGYKPNDLFLPEPFDPHAQTLVTFTTDEIKQIINNESKQDPLFKRGNGSLESQPLTLERLAATYTVDERRAIYDAVVKTMPSVHDLSDLALPSSSSDASGSKPKSRLEVLAELRDMRRRRTRYRGSAPAKNYSHTLRELIATQMEMYTGVKTEDKIEQNDHKTSNKTGNGTHKDDTHPHAHERIINKINERENFKHRDHVREERYSKYSRHSDKYESTTHLKESDRTYNKHNDGMRQRDYKDSYSDRSTSNSIDRTRHEKSDRKRCRERSTDSLSSKHRARQHDRIDNKRYRDKSADKSRSTEKYRRYYDYGQEKQEKHRKK